MKKVIFLSLIVFLLENTCSIAMDNKLPSHFLTDTQGTLFANNPQQDTKEAKNSVAAAATPSLNTSSAHAAPAGAIPVNLHDLSVKLYKRCGVVCNLLKAKKNDPKILQQASLIAKEAIDLEIQEAIINPAQSEPYYGTKILETLLNNGLEPNARSISYNNDHLTPLLYCCFKGALKSFLLLKQRGARLDITTHGGATPYLLIANNNIIATLEKNFLHMINELLNSSAIYSIKQVIELFERKKRESNTDRQKEMLNRYIHHVKGIEKEKTLANKDISSLDKDQKKLHESALHETCTQEVNLAIQKIEEIRKIKGSLSHNTHAMQQALADAHDLMFESIEQNDIESVKKLLAIGLPIDFIDPDTKDTAFLMACGYRRLEIIQLLKSAGANIHAVNTKDGNSGIMNAFSSNYDYDTAEQPPRGDLLPVLELLTSSAYNLDVNLPNYRGHNGFKYVARNPIAKELLVRAGISMNHRFTKTINMSSGKKFITAGDSLLMVAARVGNNQIVEAILKSKLAPDPEIVCALHIAQENHRKTASTLLKDALTYEEKKAEKAFQEICKEEQDKIKKAKENEQKKLEKDSKAEQEKNHARSLENLCLLTDSTVKTALEEACKELLIEQKVAKEQNQKIEHELWDKALKASQEKAKQEAKKRHKEQQQEAQDREKKRIEAQEKQTQEKIESLPEKIDVNDFNDFKNYMEKLGATVEQGNKTDGFETSIVAFSQNHWIKYYKVNEKLWAQREAALVLKEQFDALKKAESLRALEQKKKQESLRTSPANNQALANTIKAALPNAQVSTAFEIIQQANAPAALPILTAPRAPIWRLTAGIKKLSLQEPQENKSQSTAPNIDDIFTHIHNTDRQGIIHCLQQASQPIINQVHQQSGDTPLLRALSYIEKNSHSLSEQQKNELINIVMYLLMKGANPQTTNTILHYSAIDLAVSYMHKTQDRRLTDLLIKAGISPEHCVAGNTVQEILDTHTKKCVQSANITPATNKSEAAAIPTPQKKPSIADPNAKIKDFLNSAAAGSLMKLQIMLKNGDVQINTQCDDIERYHKNTALHEVLYWLLGIIKKKELSAEDIHQQKNYLNIALYLLKKGADFTIKNADNASAQDYATIYYRLTGDAQLLIAMGITPNDE